ncbi:hypothetical protein LWI28_014800 [Acer negundo]|uniref:Uncharacterized protein n=1 Tax=Acer negundo TaxID=4023 RepID=A0AAD5JHX8_ACENE|nr:hypothetical protein LWI28_014800 [Acer negundo]
MQGLLQSIWGKSLLTMLEPRTQHLKVVRTEARARFKVTNRGIMGNTLTRAVFSIKIRIDLQGHMAIEVEDHMEEVVEKITRDPFVKFVAELTTAVNCYYRYDDTYNWSPLDQSKGNNNNSAYIATPETSQDQMRRVSTRVFSEEEGGEIGVGGQDLAEVDDSYRSHGSIEVGTDNRFHDNIEAEIDNQRIDTSDAVLEFATSIAEQGRHHMITRARDGI